MEYPCHLNPFGDEESDTDATNYPDHLDPFGEDNLSDVGSIHSTHAAPNVDEYDDSLNPFGVDEEKNVDPDQPTQVAHEEKTNDDRPATNHDNPFDENSDRKNVIADSSEERANCKIEETNAASKISISQPESLESTEPPKPLPRTKSLLKKEMALKRRRQEQQDKVAPSSLPAQTSDTPSPSALDSAASNLSSNPTNAVNSFQRRKNKRVAPPVPVNYKREVSGSLDAIEGELNDMGDLLGIIEKETNICLDTLKEPDVANQADFSAIKKKFIELIKRKNSIVRRQKELMYTKRELKLNQIHSDIEYELRMIGNKQLSTRTAEDEAKEKELLKKLVEIVEEKSDIVENLNKDTSCDSQDIEEAFRRLNLVEHLSERESLDTSSILVEQKIGPKNKDCDIKSLNRFKKIATLLPKGHTIKGTMKLKRKHLFRRSHESQQQPPIER